MGGGVIYNALVAEPGLVSAAVVFAPVSSLEADNFDRWIRDGSEDAGPVGQSCARTATPGGTRLLARVALATVLRPDHRAGADPPRNPTTLPDRVVPAHAAAMDVWVCTRGCAVPGGGARVHPAVERSSMQRTAAFLDRHLRG